jgi:hypothetical protein
MTAEGVPGPERPSPDELSRFLAKELDVDAETIERQAADFDIEPPWKADVETVEPDDE